MEVQEALQEGSWRHCPYCFFLMSHLSPSWNVLLLFLILFFTKWQEEIAPYHSLGLLRSLLQYFPHVCSTPYARNLAHLGPASKSFVIIPVLFLIFQLTVPKIRSKTLARVFSMSVQEQETNFMPSTDLFLYHNKVTDFTHYHDIYLTKAE